MCVSVGSEPAHQVADYSAVQVPDALRVVPAQIGLQHLARQSPRPQRRAPVARSPPSAPTISAMSLGSNAPYAQPHARFTAVLLFGGAAAAVIALHLATDHTLGFHTDELYYLDCGRHPALGYVDFPPVVPLLARLETGLLGVSPWTLRLLPSLLGGFLVALSGAYVRRLGGSLRLQGLALLTAIAAPFLLGANWVFQTVTFDQVTWMVAPPDRNRLCRSAVPLPLCWQVLLRGRDDSDRPGSRAYGDLPPRASKASRWP